MKTLHQIRKFILENANHHFTVRSSVRVCTRPHSRFERAKSPRRPLDDIVNVVHGVACGLAVASVGMRHDSVAEMSKPTVYPAGVVGNQCLLERAYQSASHKRPTVINVYSERKGLIQRMFVICAMLRNKIARLDGLLHRGDRVTKQPEPPAFIYRGFFHFLHNVIGEQRRGGDPK